MQSNWRKKVYTAIEEIQRKVAKSEKWLLEVGMARLKHALE